MSIHKLLFVGLFLLAVQAVNASDVHLSRDTLYCNLEEYRCRNIEGKSFADFRFECYQDDGTYGIHSPV